MNILLRSSLNTSPKLPPFKTLKKQDLMLIRLFILSPFPYPLLPLRPLRFPLSLLSSKGLSSASVTCFLSPCNHLCNFLNTLSLIIKKRSGSLAAPVFAVPGTLSHHVRTWWPCWRGPEPSQENEELEDREY